MDSFEEDLKTTGVINWRRKSQDRDQWKAIVKEAKAHHGLQRLQKNKNKNNFLLFFHLFFMQSPVLDA
jgi:hypothetical protein